MKIYYTLKKFVSYLINCLYTASTAQLSTAFLFGITSSVISLFLFSPFLKSCKQIYPDLIVGSITWVDYCKTFDYLIVFVFLAVFFVMWTISLLLTSRLWHRIEKTYCQDKRRLLNFDSHYMNHAILVCVGVVAYVAGFWFVSGTMNGFKIIAFFLIVGGVLYLKDVTTGKSEWFGFRFVLVVLISIFTYLSFFAVLTVFYLINPIAISKFTQAISDGRALYLLYIFSFITIILAFIFDKSSLKSWCKFCYLSQILLPLLFLIPLREVYQKGNTLMVIDNIPLRTELLFVSISLLGVVYNVYSLRRYASSVFAANDFSYSDFILMPSLLSFIFLISYTNYVPSYNGFISGYFHLGELIVPWQQITHFGLRAYHDFIPIHGFMDVLYGAVNSIFFKGTAFSFFWVMRLLMPAFACANIYLLSRFVGKDWSLLLSFSFIPVRDRFFLVLPIILILSLPVLLERPLLWLVLWYFFSMAHILYNHSPMGIALTLATIPFGLYFFIIILKKGLLKDTFQKHSKTTFLILSFIAVSIVFLVPYFRVLLTFLINNSSAHSLGNGIGWFQSTVIPVWFPWKEKLIWEGVRVGGWMLGILVLWHLFILNLKRDKSGVTHLLSPATIIALAGMLFTIFIIPYSMVRIDVNELSRTGVVTALILGSLLPLVILLTMLQSKRFTFIGILFLFLFIGMQSGLDAIAVDDLVSTNIFNPVQVLPDAVFVDGKKFGIPNVGKGFMQENKVREIIEFKKILGGLLKRGETYYDLTNRIAMYFYIDKPAPWIYLAGYNAVNYEIQTEVINVLKRKKPPVVFILPGRFFDNALFTLRSYRIYKWFMNNAYILYRQNGFSFLIRKDRYDELGLRRFNQNDKGYPYQKNLRALPIAWGRNLKSLMPRFRRYDMDAAILYKNSNTIAWRFKEPIDGSKYDFIRLKTNCSKESGVNGTGTGKLYWANGKDFSDKRSLVFDINTENDYFLIPMGSHPDWMGSQEITDLTLYYFFHEDVKCSSFDIKPMELIK